MYCFQSAAAKSGVKLAWPELSGLMGKITITEHKVNMDLLVEPKNALRITGYDSFIESREVLVAPQHGKIFQSEGLPR